MKTELKRILDTEYRILAIQTRQRLELTQREMGVRLMMTESSYSDIETGHAGCGTLTQFLLLEMQEKPEVFIREDSVKFAACCEAEMQSV